MPTVNMQHNVPYFEKNNYGLHGITFVVMSDGSIKMLISNLLITD
jgi:hypothetical protein